MLDVRCENGKRSRASASLSRRQLTYIEPPPRQTAMDIALGIDSVSNLASNGLVYWGTRDGKPVREAPATQTGFFGNVTRMTTANRPTFGATAAPSERPPRVDLLTPMLKGTHRGAVPVRRAFLQKPPGTKGPRDAAMARLARDSSALDAYLLIHALASSSEPYVAHYPAATWTQLARLDEAATFDAAKSRWSKVVSKLVTLKLVERERKGNDVQYRLLHEAADGAEYTRPRKGADGHWLRLPYSYWLDGFDASLSHPEKLMLLIALDQQENFVLPLNQSSKWYGLSEATARRGLRGLEDKELLRAWSSFVPSPRSPTGWMQEFTYTLLGPFSLAAVEKAAATRGRVFFTDGSDT